MALISPVISAVAEINSLPLVNNYPGTIALDQHYIYWAAAESDQLYRLPIARGENELLASSRLTEYSDGSLSSYWIQRGGNWLIFTDARQNDIGSWAIHALNLQTKEDKVMLQETGSHAPMWSPPPDYSAEGDWLAWTRLELGHSTRCDQSILGITNLATSEERELERVCTADHYIWSIPHLSGDQLIVEQDLPDREGRKNNIFVWNWKTGERTALTTNGYSSMPAVSGKWVVWKQAPRYTASQDYIIYNLETGARQTFRGLKCWVDPRVSGQWLYSSVCKNSFTVYDLEKQHMVNIVQLPKGESFRGFALSDEWAVWGVARNTASGKEFEIQWRRLP
jgi:Tol biopolymer transport system component